MRTRWTAFDKGVVKEINRVRTFVGPRLTRLSESFKSISFPNHFLKSLKFIVILGRPELKDAVKAQRDKIMSDFTVIRTRASKGVRFVPSSLSFHAGDTFQLTYHTCRALRRKALEDRKISFIYGRMKQAYRRAALEPYSKISAPCLSKKRKYEIARTIPANFTAQTKAITSARSTSFTDG